jgi:membrane protease YdiL (CAAX protease family)
MFSVGDPGVWPDAVHSTSAWVFTFLLAVVFPVIDYVLYARLKSTLQIYAWNILALWSLAGGCVWITRMNYLTLNDLGERPGNAYRTLVISGILIAIVVLLIGAQKKQKKKVSSQQLNDSLDTVRRLLPKTSTERAVWIVVSITAGICEEVLYRGWLLSLFAATLGSVWLGLLISSIIFGFAHAYQGRPAILGTGAIGAIFGFLFILSGSLIPGQVLHAAMDLNNGLALGKAAKRTEA